MSKGTWKGKLIALLLIILLNYMFYIGNAPPMYFIISYSIPLIYWKIVRDNDKFIVKGQSEYWKISLEYKIRENDKILVEGNSIYIGDKPPKKVDMTFVPYNIESTSIYYSNAEESQSIPIELKGQPVKDSKINISQSFNRSHNNKVYEEAVNSGYLEIKWEYQGKEKIERVNIEIVL